MTVWYAQGAGDIEAVVWKDAPSSGNTLTWASRAAGDVFVANGNAITNANRVDPGANGLVTLQTNGTSDNGASGGTDGGSFACTTAGGNLTLTAHLGSTNSTTACMTATLSTTNILTVLGNCRGGSGANSHGLVSTTAQGKINLGANGTTITATGGTIASADGVHHVTGGIAAGQTWYANAVGSVGIGINVQFGTTGTLTLLGNITSSATSGGMFVNASAASTIIHTGNLVQGNTGTTPGPFPISFYQSLIKYRWLTADGGTITLYDGSGNAHVLKVPDYPALNKVLDIASGGATFDYGTKTGTYTVTAGGSSGGMLDGGF